MPDFSFSEGLKKQFKDQESAGVRASFSFASQYSTADYADARNVAKKAGVSTAAVLDPEVRKILAPIAGTHNMTPEEFLGTAPVSAKWIQKDPDNAALSFSSLPQVSDLEVRHQQLVEEHRKEIEANNRARGVSYGEGTLKNVAGSLAGLAAIPWDLGSAGTNFFLPKEAAETVLGIAEYPMFASKLASDAQQWYQDRGYQNENLLMKDPKTGEEFLNWSAFSPTRLAGWKNYGQILSSEAVPFIVQALIAEASGGASLVGLAGKAGKLARFGKLATSAPALIEISRTIQGQYNEGVRQLRAQGMDESSAQQKVAGGALLAGAFSFVLGAPMESKFFEHLEELANHVPGGSIAQRAWARAKAFVSSGMKEGLQETLNGIGEDSAAFLTYNDDMTAKEFAANLFQNAIGGVLLGGPSGAMIQGTHAARKGQQYDAQRKFLEQLADPEKRGELGKLAPDKFGELVSEITKGGPIEDLAIPAKAWDTFWQSVGEDPDAKAAEMGVGLEDLRVARESEGDLVLSTGTVAEKIAGTDHFLGLLPSMKPGLSSDSFGEIQAQAQAVEANEKLLADMASVEDSDERNQIRNIIASELKAASKVYNESQANTIADGYSRVIMVQAKRTEQTPLQLFEKERVKILDHYAKMEEQEVARGTDQPEGSTGPSAVQGEGVGRDAGSVHGSDGSVPSGVPQGELADAPAGLEFAAGVRPPSRLWHGTSGNFSQLVAEGLTPNQAGGMPGLNLSAGPDVMGSYAEGNQDGHWKVQLDDGFRPIDLSPEKLYTPEQVQALGFTDAEKPYSGHDLWMYAMSRLGSEGAKAHFMGLGFNGSYYAHGGEDAYSVWLDSLIKRQGKTTMAQAQAEYALQGSRRDSVTGELKVAAQTVFQPLNTRQPSSNPSGVPAEGGGLLLSGYQAILDAPPANSKEPPLREKLADLVSTYPGMRVRKGTSATKVLEQFVEHVKGNLLWLYAQYPQEIRDRAKAWYDGANAIAQKWANEHSKTLAQVTAVIAALSPGKEWNLNVEQARRIMVMYRDHADHKWDGKMEAWFQEQGFAKKMQSQNGKGLHEIEDYTDKAIWVRAYDAVYGSKEYHIIGPSGEPAGLKRNQGKKGQEGEPTKFAFAELGTIAKALKVLDDGTPENISEAIGSAHKVRNFYNNIFDPSSALFTTVDTHAVGAGLILPVAQSSDVVIHALSGASTKSTGAIGTYGLFQEAYIRAAAEVGILPRQMQSITWEAVRGLFEAKQKSAKDASGEPKLRGEVEAIWKQYTKGKATLDDTRSAIKALAGNIKAPDWSGLGETYFQSVGSPEATAQAELNAPTISVESMPGSNVRAQVLPGIENASPEQLNAYHEAKMQIVEDALREGGIKVVDSATGYGYWDGESNLVTGFHLASIEDAQRAAQLVAAVVGDQDAIGWNAQVNEPDVEKHNAVLLEFSRPLTEQEATKLGDELAKTGLPAFHDASNPAAVKVINYDMGEGSALDFHAKIEALANGLLTEGLTVDPQSYAAISNLEKAPNETGPGQSPSLAPHVDRGRSRIADLNSRFIRQFAERGQPPEDRGQPRIPVLQRGSTGGANPVSVIGTHYGAVEGLTKLDPSKHGTGSAGREMRRLSAIDPGSEQAVLKQRAYFYVQDGEGLPKKERVVRGSSPYLAQFNNVYDLDADPEGLRGKSGGDLNALEMSVLKAGYDAYLGSAPGVPGRALVVLGPGSIPVVPSDASGKPAVDLEGPDGGVTLFQPAYHGTPFNFSKFSLEHLGKGEGAQAYGWGLYFAGDKGVAEWYRKQLAHLAQDAEYALHIGGEKVVFDNSDGGIFRAGGRELGGTHAEFDAMSTFETFGIEEGLRQAQSDVEEFSRQNKVYGSGGRGTTSGQLLVRAQEKLAFMQQLISEGLTATKNPPSTGQLYEVDIPSNAQLLDQEKLLSKQPAPVQRSLRQMLTNMAENENHRADMGAANRVDFVDRFMGGGFHTPLTGAQTISALTSLLGSPEKVSRTLNEYGIKGSKYYDGNTRGKDKKKTYNYVIFDDEAITILNTFYQSMQDGQDPSEFARGFLRFGQRGQDGSRTFNLGLLQQENHSTVFHELGHFYLELLGDLAADPNANQSVRDDYATILKWFGVSDRSQITRDMHEQFADAHLVYLLEGKAPAIELIGPFRKFTRWLTKVGKQLLQADVPMNDEVRKVFDRLYAVDEEIEAAKGVLGPELFATAEQAGLSQAEFDLLRKHRAKAIEEAKERLISKVMKELERSRKQEWKDELATAKARISEELGARPEYVAQKAMNEKVAPDGTSLEGMTDDESAVILGFDDGAQLRETLKNTRPLEKVVNELAKAYMVEQHGDLLETGQIKDEALKLLAGARLEESLKAELEVLRRLAKKEQPFIAEGRRQQKAQDRADQAEIDKARTDAERAARAQDTEGRKQAKDILRASTFKATAAAYIRNLPLHRVKPMQYLGLQKKFDMQAYKAALRNDYQAAAEAKERALLNHYLYLEAERAVEEGEKARAWLKRNDSSTVRGKIGKAGGDFLAHFDAIRDRFGIERAPAKLLEAVHTLAEWAQMMEDSHEDTVVAQWLLDQGAVVNYRELSANQLNDVINALKNIKHLAYRETTMLINGQRIERAQALSEIISSAKANNSSKPLARASSPDRERAAFKAKGFLAGFDASLVKIETLINYIDGNDVNGPAHRYIWDRIVSAQAKMLDLQGEVNRKLIGVLEQMPPELRASMDEHVVVPGWTGANLTRKEIVTMALYSGQDSRRLKLVKGWERFGMSDATLTKALSMLTAEEVSLVNSVWEAFDTIRPMVLDLEERLSGVRPEWENATPRDVYDPNGTFVGHLKGGYFPLVADSTFAGELGKKQEGGPVGQLFGNGYARASTSKGHTKELTGATYPLLLDFQNTLSSQLANQIKDLAFREAVLDINRIFKSKEFQLAIKETLGEPYEAQLMPWLVNVVNDFNAGSTNGLAWWNRAATTVKSHTVAAMLGFKLSTVFMQVTDLARATSPGDFRVGTRALAKAYMQFLAHPDQTIEMVRELSGEMRHRAEALDRDLRSEFNRLRGKQTLKARWNRIGFKMLGWVDTIFSTPVWLGAYQDALRSGADEDTAIRTADRTVRTRLMTSHPKDIVAVQRNNELMKLLTMFMGDSFTNYNMLRQSGHNLDSLKRISSFTAQTVMLGLLFALGEMIRGQGPEDDEDDLLWLLRKMAMYPTQIVPVVKDGASALENTFTGKPFNKYQLSPVVAWAQKSLDVVPATVKFVEGDIEWDDYLIKAGEGLGYALGIGGTNQLTASAKYFKRYTEGEEEPSNPLEFGFDLARGKRKEN